MILVYFLAAVFIVALVVSPFILSSRISRMEERRDE